jgi:L-threonylcarbamoyladenylate synthase
VFSLKNRASFDPLIVHVKSIEQALSLSKNLPDAAIDLMSEFWPGPLTIVVTKNELIPDIVTSGLDTVGLRMPDHPLTIQLLEQLDFPLAAPSANPFGYVSPTRAQHVLEHFDGRIPYILDGGPCKVGVESTIIGFESDEPVVYRKGGIGIDDLERVIGTVTVKNDSASNPIAPGMLKSHYATRIPLIIGNVDNSSAIFNNKKVAVISFSGTEPLPSNFTVYILSETGSDEEAARNLFKTMRDIDKEGFDLIIAEKFPDNGLGCAINDRLMRAAAPRH